MHEVIRTYVHHNGQRASVVMMQCDTDFVGRNEEFLKFVDDYAMGLCSLSVEYDHLWETNPVTDKMFIEDILEARNKFGENIRVKDVQIILTEKGCGCNDFN